MLGLEGEGRDMLGRDILGLAPPPTLPIDGRAPPRPF